MFSAAMVKVAIVFLFPTLFYLSLNNSRSGQEARGNHAPVDELPDKKEEEVAANRGLSGLWALDWDDVIDGKLGEERKSCDVRLRVIDQELVGNFDGPVLGEQREAVFLGTVYGDSVPLIMFTQREEGYTCSYHIYWNPGDAGPPVGTWHDSRGGSGEFSLLKYQ